RRLDPHGDLFLLPASAVDSAGYPASVPLSRRRTQGGFQLRIRPAAERRERAEVCDLPSALRHLLSAGDSGDFHDRLRASADRRLRSEAGSANHLIAADRGLEL